MQTQGPYALILQNRFCAIFRRTNSIHQYPWHRYFAYTSLTLLTCVLCASVARSQTSALAFSPSPGNFGSVAVGSIKAIPVTLRNSSRGPVTISKAAVNAAGFNISGLTTPFTISGGASISFVTKFAPTSTGLFSGSISFSNNATNSAVQYSVLGTGTATSGGISGTPSVISFGTVATGTTNSQTVQLRNNGNSSVTISSASVSG